MTSKMIWLALVVLGVSGAARAGIYSQAYGNDLSPNAYDEPVPSYVGPDGDGFIGGANVINPEFLGWATGYDEYAPASGITWPTFYGVPSKAFGPATGDQFDVLCLGELYDQASPPPVEDTYGNPVVSDPEWIGVHDPGRITLTFGAAIRNGPGADVAVFENGIIEAPPSVMFAELAYVEVSSDGTHFARFPSVSLTGPLPPPHPEEGSQSALDVTNVHNLAGKHTNADDSSWGTPFDLDDLADDPLVIAGTVDLRKIQHVRIVDIPGSGYFLDGDENPIYDPWWTFATGGFDLDAVGVLNERPDFDGDGNVDGDDADLLSAAVRASSTDLHFDMDGDGDVDGDDLTALAASEMETLVGVGTVAGDFNLDGLVNATDLANLANFFGQVQGWADGNANYDETVNATDLAILQSTFGFSAPTGSVPEPATMSLLVVGAAALLKRRRADL